MKNRVLIIDSNSVMGKGLQDLLVQSGRFESDIADSMQTASEMMADKYYDARVLDEEMLNDTAWYCQDNAAQERIPVAVILTNQEAVHVDIGGESEECYLSKPFKLADLLDCLQQIVPKNQWQFGNWHFWADENYLQMAGAHQNLTEKETAILSYLCRAGGRIVRREHLLKDVWGYQNNVDTHTLETHIYRLRRKIEPEISKPQLLLTEKDGYRLENIRLHHKSEQ